MRIVQKDDPALRRISREVPIDEIKSKKIQEIIANMKSALHKEKDGVAIAAPQIGINLRIFVISGKIFDIQSGEYDEKTPTKSDDLVCINPVLSKLSRKRNVVEEGCLSVRYLYGKLSRSEKATITAYNENGVKFTRGASGLLAQAFQHETDHLNGILFIDSAQDLVDMPPQDK